MVAGFALARMRRLLRESAMTECLYQRHQNLFSPTPVAASPWHPSMLHGGAVSALFGLLMDEQVAIWPEFMVNRLTMNLLRPVPMEPLESRCVWLREGGRLRVLAVELLAQGRLVARAEALMQKVTPVVLPDYAPRPEPAPAGPAGLPEFGIQSLLNAKDQSIPPGFHTRVEVREVTPWDEQGATTAWVRVPVEIVPGVSTTPLMRAAMVSDLGNGTGQLSLGPGVGCINADITLALFRYPRSEWLCLASQAVMTEAGCGVVHTRLYDEQGAIGHVLQCTQTNGEYRG